MSVLKPIGTALVIMLLTLAFMGCSPSRKVKKKCRECPEFSITAPAPDHTMLVYGRI